MLDKNSFRIMIELCRNGRISNAKIAKTLGMSELTVAKKINAMLKNEIIAIKAIPNPVKMGYQASALIGLNVDMKRSDEICARLMDNVHINLVMTCFGKFDILLIVYFSEWKMLQDFIREELPKIKGINSIYTYLISEARKLYQESITNNEENEPKELDELDQALIKELIKNGDPNYNVLARKLSTSVSTVSRRIAAMLRSEVIRILGIPNPSKLGYLVSAFVLLHVDISKVNKIYQQLAVYSEIHLVMRLMNGADILFGINATDPQALYDFMKNKIANINGILGSETFIRGNFLYFSADALFMPSLR